MREVSGEQRRGQTEMWGFFLPASESRSKLHEPDLEALKGRDNTAQGNALGSNSQALPQALKGRNIALHNEFSHFQLIPANGVELWTRISPLQGLGFVRVHGPRALPWAVIFRPVGARV